MTSKENKFSQNYLPLNQTTYRLSLHYKKELAEAIGRRDVNRVKIILSSLAVLNPLEYKEYLSTRKRNIKR